MAVPDPARGTGVLALDADADGVAALLHVAGLVGHECCLLVVQVLDHVDA